MSRIALFGLLLMFYSACTKSQLFTPEQVVRIKVRLNAPNQADMRIIEEKKEIKKILGIINEGSPEVIKFYPKWHLIIIDISNKEHLVMCSEKEINYNGKTYRLGQDIKQVLFD